MDISDATIRLRAFGELDETEISALMELSGPLQHFRRGENVREEGDATPRMYFLLSGWTASSVLLPRGERQAIKVHMPGDLLGMPGLALASAPDTITALADVAVSVVEPQSIRDIFRYHSRIAAMLFLISQEERVYLIDRLASIGRTGAINRIAALVIHLDARMTRSAGRPVDCFFLPLTRNDIADLTALTHEHVSRTLKLLAKHNLCTWKSRQITIYDRAELQKLAALPTRTLRVESDWLASKTTQ